MSGPVLQQEQPLGRRGPWFAAIWLFFLLDPFLVGWHHRGTVAGVLGMLLTVAFGATYMWLWLQLRADRARLRDEPPVASSLLWLAGLVTLGLLMVVALGQVGTTAAVYVAVATMMLFPFVVGAAIVVGIAALVVVTGELVPGWDRSIGLAFSVCAASLAIFGIRSMLRRNIDLIRAHEENAELLVENERTRFARDLHDILGHSLTVITVKAELAGRLMDADPARAKAEIADLERLSRDALADVRRAVEGYRDLTLPGELARARAALEAAEIQAVLPNTTEEVPTDLRELFAWTVREGVTNVIRHSHARTCRVVISPTGVEVTDDGDGAAGETTGSGLRGLRERAAAAGATVVTRSLSPGFSLSVVRA
ncbi:sensor histidine kinase [Nocardioides islandensis]|jgi:two-component system sensor histidine kinase DesK|nr:histidine kinase [Nocardioides islandensis]